MRSRQTERLVKRLLVTVLLALAPVAPAQAAVRGLGSWDPIAQRMVREAGVMPSLATGGFGGAQRLDGTELSAAFGALSLRLGVAPVNVPAGHVSVTRIDALLVEQLGMGDVAQAVQAEAARVGLRPGPRFGTEVVARQLGLRFNHDSAHDAQELYPWEAITRAEAAWSLATVLQFDGSQQAYAREVLARFQLPDYTAAQRAALRIAVSKVGMPYIWGGETDSAGSWFGWQAHGGYDCSGLVWRVFILGRQPAGAHIHGRTAAAMAAEIPRAQRLRTEATQPGDLLFFGRARIWQRVTWSNVTHVGIALGNGFMINSSGQGVTVAPLWEDWRVKGFSFARRVL
jgi:cell wall-associated NlpC family hydrolase